MGSPTAATISFCGARASNEQPARAERAAAARPRAPARLPDRGRPGRRRGPARRAARAAAHGGRGRRRRADPAARPSASQHLSRPRQARRAQGRAGLLGRQSGGLRRRALTAPGAQPRGGARPPGDRPHGDHPRHLRLPCPHGRGQAPGRARAARVQPGPDAGPVDAPRAARRRPYRRRHRDPRTGRDPDRDRPAAGARPDLRAQAQARPRPLEPIRDARRARAHASALGGARRLHERRQVDAAERAHRRQRRRPRSPVPHARSDHPPPASRRSRLPADRHGRLHPQAPPPAGRGVRRHARGDAAGRPDPARRRRLGPRGRAAGHDPRGRGRAGRDRRRGRARDPRPGQGRPDRRRAPGRATAPPSGGPCSSRR